MPPRKLCPSVSMDIRVTAVRRNQQKFRRRGLHGQRKTGIIHINDGNRRRLSSGVRPACQHCSRRGQAGIAARLYWSLRKVLKFFRARPPQHSVHRDWLENHPGGPPGLVQIPSPRVVSETGASVNMHQDAMPWRLRSAASLPYGPPGRPHGRDNKLPAVCDPVGKADRRLTRTETPVCPPHRCIWVEIILSVLSPL